MLRLFLPQRKNTYPLSNHCDGKRFFNPHAKEKFHFFRLLKWLIKRKQAKWPKWVQNHCQCQIPIELKEKEIAITFINHASFLIQTTNLNILIDPIYSKRPSPSFFFGFKRVRLPGVPFDSLPSIDLVLISHNHYDHLDIPTLKRLKKTHNPLFISGLGNKKFLNSYGFKKVIELDWWEKYTYQNCAITFLPAQHFSARSPFDRNKTLWGGFMIEILNKKIYHVGDSGYGPHFKEIKNKLGSPDISLLPIGCYKPRWFMKMMHINPEEAIQAYIELNSKIMIPMHYGTFQLSDEPYEEPLTNLEIAKEKHCATKIKVLDFGETYLFS